MNKYIKFISILCLLMLCMPFTSNAIDGDLTYEEGAVVYTPTPEDMMIKIKKEMKLAKMELQDKLKPQPRVWFNEESLDVEKFEQVEGHYCGPATVKQVLHYLEGYSKTQKYYADKLGTTSDGTDMTVIPKVLNEELGKREYHYDGGEKHIRTWMRNIRGSIRSGFPVILDIRLKSEEHIKAFGYDTWGHFLNVSGYKEYTNGAIYIKITDPYKPEEEEKWKLHNGWIDIDTLYDCNMAHPRKAMIW